MTLRPLSFSKCLQRRRSFGTLIAKDNGSIFFASSEQGLKFDRILDLGESQNPALLGGLDRVCLHALDVEP